MVARHKVTFGYTNGKQAFAQILQRDLWGKIFQQQPKLTYEFPKVQMEITRDMCLKMWTASTEIKRQFPVDIIDGLM